MKLADRLKILAAALALWKCDACGGSGEYIEPWTRANPANGRDDSERARVPCKRCDQSGIHPTAFAALKKSGMV